VSGVGKVGEQTGGEAAIVACRARASDGRRPVAASVGVTAVAAGGGQDLAGEVSRPRLRLAGQGTSRSERRHVDRTTRTGRP
jgi:hypothetical protein